MNDSSQFASERLRAASRAKDQAKRLAWGFLISAATLELLLAVALLDYWLELPVSLRLGGFFLLLLLLAAGVGGGLKLRRRPTSLKEAALDAEAQRADLGCVTSTAAEYISGERAVTHEYEPELVAALEEQAARNLRKAQVSYSSRMLAPAGFLAFALFTLLVFVAVAPVAFTAFKRTVAPWTKETYSKVQVLPGNVEIPVGHDLDITNLFSGRVPKDPALHWQESGKPAWQLAPLNKSSDGSYVYPFKKLQDSVKYRVTGNDAVSQVYEITTYIPPEVRAWHVGVAYPPYTGVKPFQQQTPEVTALRASDLVFRITSTSKLSKARIRFSSLPGIDLVPVENDEWVAGFKAVTNAEYWIELADAKGHKGGNEQPFHLKVLPDKPPKVEILDPGQDIRAEATNTIPVKFAASDDFGITEIKLIYHRLGGPEQVLKCAYTNTTPGEVMGGVELPLASLDLKEYELVAYHAEALDNNTLDGPGKGMSRVYFIEITNEESGKSKAKAKSDGQNMNLLAIQKQIIAETTVLAAKESPDRFDALASREKEASDYAAMYRDSLTQLGAPAEAVKLMEDALSEMKNASGSLAERKRDAALPPEEKALADLYQVLKAMPKLDNLPTQPPPEAQAEQDPAVSVALSAIKKQKKDPPSDEEIAQALEQAKQLDRAQGEMLQALDPRGQPDENGQPSEQSGSGGKSKNAKEKQQAKAGAKANQESQERKPGPTPGQGKENSEAKGEAKAGEGKDDQQAKDEPKPGEEIKGQEAKAGGKSGEGKGPEAKADKQAGKGKEGQQAKAGAKAGGGKQASDQAQPGDGKQEQDLETLAELENDLSKEAAALAEKLEKIAIKDNRLGHTAAKKASQAAGQMGAAAQALRQGNRGAAGTEGGQGLLNMDKVVASLERLLKDQPNFTDVATEDSPKEYDALISEYLRKLSHEK